MRNITSEFVYNEDHVCIKTQYFVKLSEIKQILDKYQRKNGFSGYEYWIPLDIPCMKVITYTKRDETLFRTEISVMHCKDNDNIQCIPIQNISIMSGEGTDILYNELGLFREWILIEDIIKYREIIPNIMQ